MNHSNHSNSFQQNTAFDQKLNNFQSVIGLANWNFSSPSYGQDTYFQRQHARLQSNDGSFTYWLWVTAKGLASRAVMAVAKNKQRRKELNQLLAMDDSQLNDIGISRADVHAVVQNKITPAELNIQRSKLAVASVNQASIKQANEASKTNLPKCATSQLDISSKPVCSNDQSNEFKTA